jgi:hypothetical protein
MSKQRNVKGGSSAVARWFRRPRHDKVSIPFPKQFTDGAGLPIQLGHLERFHQLKRIWRNLSAILPRVSRPTRAEIEADEYDGSVPISQWLGRDSQQCDIRCRYGRSIEGGPRSQSQDASLRV